MFVKFQGAPRKNVGNCSRRSTYVLRYMYRGTIAQNTSTNEGGGDCVQSIGCCCGGCVVQKLSGTRFYIIICCLFNNIKKST